MFTIIINVILYFRYKKLKFLNETERNFIIEGLVEEILQDAQDESSPEPVNGASSSSQPSSSQAAAATTMLL